MDIYGATNSSTGKVEILAVATNLANPALALQTQLLRIDGTTVTQVGGTLPLHIPVSGLFRERNII